MEFDPEVKNFCGDVINTRDVITFQGTSVDEIETAFKESIDDYPEWCLAKGVEPEKSYSGKFNLRLLPELHQELSITAKKSNVSLESLAVMRQ